MANDRGLLYANELSDLIKIETVSSRTDPSRDKFIQFHEELKRKFPLIHKNCEKKVFNGSLLFKWSGKGQKEPILFMSHHDTVEASGKWEHEPFGGEIIDGVIWGRGTVDTKASLYCFLKAAEELMSEGYEPEGDIYLASSCTEEWSGEGAPLTAKYLKDNGVKLRFMLDEGGMIVEEPIKGVKGKYAMIGAMEKGYGDVKFTARGTGGHASAPGKNTPIARLAKFINDVEENSPFTVEFSDTALEMYRRMTPNMSGSLKFIFSNMWLFKPILKKKMSSVSPAGAAMLKTTCAFTTLKGSDGLNVLPTEAYVTANMRFIHHQPTDESIKIMADIAKKYDIETEVIYKDYPCKVVNYNGEEFKLIEKIVKEFYPDVITTPYIMTGGTDSKFYNDVCDNCIRFAPLEINAQQLASIHALNENINVDVLPKGVDCYKKIMQSWL